MTKSELQHHTSTVILILLGVAGISLTAFIVIKGLVPAYLSTLTHFDSWLWYILVVGLTPLVAYAIYCFCKEFLAAVFME